MSKRYQALLDERAGLVKEAQDLFKAAEAEGRDLTDEERERDDAINARLETLAGEIQREERRREWERTVAAVPDGNVQAAQQSRIEGVRDRAEEDPHGGFRDLGDFAVAVKQASRPGGFVDERLRYGAAPTNYHQETGADEGYMVPPAMRQEIWDMVFDDQDLLAMVDPEPTNSNSVDLIADESTPWGSSGIEARWRTEGNQMTADKLQTDPRHVRLHEVYAFVLATEELLQDAPRLNNRLTRGASEAIRWKVSEAIMNGTGAGQPLGWMNSGAVASQAKESGQAADTVVAGNVAKMYSRVIDPQFAIWLVNQDVLPQLLTMTLGDQPIWTPPASGFANAPGGFLFGRPVQFTDHAATVGDLGDIQVVNPMGYYAATREEGPRFASSIHLYFDYNMQAFRWTFRFGGQPFLSAPISPAKGSTTRSHFVALAERA